MKLYMILSTAPMCQQCELPKSLQKPLDVPLPQMKLVRAGLHAVANLSGGLNPLVCHGHFEPCVQGIGRFVVPGTAA